MQSTHNWGRKHETLTLCWFNVVPPSTTVAQHWTTTGSTSRDWSGGGGVLEPQSASVSRWPPSHPGSMKSTRADRTLFRTHTVYIWPLQVQVNNHSKGLHLPGGTPGRVYPFHPRVTRFTNITPHSLPHRIHDSQGGLRPWETLLSPWLDWGWETIRAGLVAQTGSLSRSGSSADNCTISLKSTWCTIFCLTMRYLRFCTDDYEEY